MGWGGAGLGANEQGIEAPISGGEIRDRNDQYKGVGLNLNDPYENFRKSKGQAFITRMKARAEERAEERGDWSRLEKNSKLLNFVNYESTFFVRNVEQIVSREILMI